MKEYDQMFSEHFLSADIVEKISSLPEEEISKIVQKVFEEVSNSGASDFYNECLKIGRRELKNQRKEEKEFVARNIARWKKALDLMELHVQLNQEAAEQFVDDYFEDIKINFPHKIDALITIHGRALLCAREIICLLKNGYSDGALARWRSLHELAVIAQFLEDQDDLVAKRYILSFNVASHKAMLQYNKYHTRTNMIPFSVEEITAQQELSVQILQEHGKELANDYGWSSIAFKNQKKSPSLFDLEEYLGLDHMRPYYKWASHYSHGNFKHPSTLLGVCEADPDDDPLILVGASNSGLTDPASLTAISLQQVTGALLFLQPSLGGTIWMKTSLKVQQMISDSLLEIEKNTEKTNA